MPLLESSSYQCSLPWRNGHVQTIYPTFFRKFPGISFLRERLELDDGDFLDLDWHQPNSGKRLVILSHGLEGNSHRIYIRGMANAFAKAGWDILAWNCRGCSGEPNRLLKYYHSGCSDDLALVVKRALTENQYSSVALIGFSMGGNITLKYLGEQGESLDPKIVGAVTFSVPVDLASSSAALSRFENRPYLKRFLRMLKQKLIAKIPAFPGQLSIENYHQINSFKEFDDRYTAPVNGFRDAEDYWERASSKPLLNKIQTPALLVNAKNDPFLAPACYPIEAARKSDFLYFEQPTHGGHVGFVNPNNQSLYWSEQRALSFLESLTREKLIAGMEV